MRHFHDVQDVLKIDCKHRKLKFVEHNVDPIQIQAYLQTGGRAISIGILPGQLLTNVQFQLSNVETNSSMLTLHVGSLKGEPWLFVD